MNNLVHTRIFWVLLFSLYTHSSYSAPLVDTDTEGTDVGNGGIGVYCDYPDGNHKWYFQDSFLLKQQNPKWDIQNQYYHNEATAFSAVNKILENYAHLDIASALHIKAGLYAYWSNPTEVTQNNYFIKVNLEDDPPIPKNCEYRQIISNIIQTKNYSHTTNYIVVNQIAFDELSFEDKVAAVLHESIYFILDPKLRKSAKTLRRVTKLTQFLLQLPLNEDLSASSKLQLQSQNVLHRYALGLYTADYNSIPLAKQSVSDRAGNYIYFYPSGTILWASINNYKITIAGKTAYLSGAAQFYANGSLKYSRLYKPAQMNINNQDIYCADALYFDESGALLKCD